MSLRSLNVEELQDRLFEAHGERAPAKWSRAQLLLRFTELEGEGVLMGASRQHSPLRTVEIEINKASRKKSVLQAYCTQNLAMEISGSETIEVLKVKALNQAYQECPTDARDYVGFGQHSALTYEEIQALFPDYCSWVQKTASEGEASPKLQRLARWLHFSQGKPPVAKPCPKKMMKKPKAKMGQASASTDSQTVPLLTELTHTVKALAKEVEDLKDEKTARRKMNISGDGTFSSEWEKASMQP